MQSDQQYEQLMLQYNQLKNGAEDIYKMIEREDFDGAITVIKARESIFLNCKCMRKYLELTPTQEQKVNAIVEEIRKLELRNMDFLSDSMTKVKMELSKTQKTERIQMAYDNTAEIASGSIINIQDDV